MDIRKFPCAPDRYLVSEDGSVFGVVGNSCKPLAEPRKLRTNQDQKGYHYIGLRGLGNSKKQKRIAVHQIVCITFHGPRPSKRHEVGHTDGDNQNNSARNLRWVTRKENAADRTRHSRTVWGEASNTARLNLDAVEAVKFLRASGWPASKLAKCFRVSAQSIYKVLKGSSWVDPKEKVGS